MHLQICTKCGKPYTGDRATHWGRTAGSDGYGPRPVCTALVEDRYAPKHKKTGEPALAVCGGALVAQDVDDADVASLRDEGALVEEVLGVGRPGSQVGRYKGVAVEQ